MQIRCEEQDEQDKKKIALMGRKEAPNPTTT